MADKIQILTHLKLLLSPLLGDNLKQVFLSGAQACGETSSFSDYDILIVLNEKPGHELKMKISDCCYATDLKYGIFTDVHVAGQEELEGLHGEQHKLQSIIEKGIYG